MEIHLRHVRNALLNSLGVPVCLSGVAVGLTLQASLSTVALLPSILFASVIGAALAAAPDALTSQRFQTRILWFVAFIVAGAAIAFPAHAEMLARAEDAPFGTETTLRLILAVVPVEAWLLFSIPLALVAPEVGRASKWGAWRGHLISFALAGMAAAAVMLLPSSPMSAIAALLTVVASVVAVIKEEV